MKKPLWLEAVVTKKLKEAGARRAYVRKGCWISKGSSFFPYLSMLLWLWIYQSRIPKSGKKKTGIIAGNGVYASQIGCGTFPLRWVFVSSKEKIVSEVSSISVHERADPCANGMSMIISGGWLRSEERPLIGLFMLYEKIFSFGLPLFPTTIPSSMTPFLGRKPYAFPEFITFQ